MDSYFSLSLSLLISIVVLTAGYLARRSITRGVKPIVYAAYVFCITALATSIHVWLIESAFLTASLLNVIGVGAMSVGGFFIFRYLAQREPTERNVVCRGNGGTI